MFTKILKFVGLLFLIFILPVIPFGELIAIGIIGYSLWKLIND